MFTEWKIIFIFPFMNHYVYPTPSSRCENRWKTLYSFILSILLEKDGVAKKRHDRTSIHNFKHFSLVYLSIFSISTHFQQLFLQPKSLNIIWEIFLLLINKSLSSHLNSTWYLLHKKNKNGAIVVKKWVMDFFLYEKYFWL